MPDILQSFIGLKKFIPRLPFYGPVARAGIKVPASSALGLSYFRSVGVLVVIIN